MKSNNILHDLMSQIAAYELCIDMKARGLYNKLC